MSVTLEGTVLDDFLRDRIESNSQTLEKEILLSGQDLVIASVVGKVKFSIPTSGTLGSGTKGECTSVTGGVKTILGTYLVTCTTSNEVGAAGTWRIESPNGVVLGDVVVTQGTSGTGAFTDPQINLTISYKTDYSDIGDYFEIDVVAGSEKLVALDFNEVNGSQDFFGVLVKAYDASDADLDCTAIVRDAVLAKSPLVWRIEYTSGGPTEPEVGDVIIGITTTTSSARIVKVVLSTGTWAGEDAAGFILVDRISADFAAENVRIEDDGPTSSEFFTTAKDRTFTTGSTHWADNNIGTTFHETDDLSLVADATGQYCLITFTNIGTALVAGVRYRLGYDYSETTAGFEFKINGSAVQTLGDAVDGTDQYIDFVADESFTGAHELRIYSKTNAAAAGDFDNFSLKEFDDMTVVATDIAGAFIEMNAQDMITREEA